MRQVLLWGAMLAQCLPAQTQAALDWPQVRARFQAANPRTTVAPAGVTVAVSSTGPV